jgi:Ca-activated chloride channel homolog
MTFAFPLALWALGLIPAGFGVYRLAVRRRARYAVRFSNLELLELVAPGRSRRSLIPPTLFVVAVISLLLALARPHATVYVPREEATVVLALDSSASMREADVEPSRLGAAKQAATAFIRQLPERFQVGLVSFSGQAQILAQPTTDRVTVSEGIASLRPDGTTAIGDAIVEALGMDPRSHRQHSRRPAAPRDRRPLAAILLLSDGSNTAGRIGPVAAAAQAAELGVPVFTIALGPPPEEVDKGAILPTPLPTSPPDYETLGKVASLTDAVFFSAPTADQLEAIYERLGSKLGLVKDHQEITFAFAAAGLVFAAASALLSTLWSGRFP